MAEYSISDNTIGEFFKLLFDHLIWSMNIFSKVSFPEISLRKIVDIIDTDD